MNFYQFVQMFDVVIGFRENDDHDEVAGLIRQFQDVGVQLVDGSSPHLANHVHAVFVFYRLVLKRPTTNKLIK